MARERNRLLFYYQTFWCKLFILHSKTANAHCRCLIARKGLRRRLNVKRSCSNGLDLKRSDQYKVTEPLFIRSIRNQTNNNAELKKVYFYCVNNALWIEVRYSVHSIHNTQYTNTILVLTMLYITSASSNWDENRTEIKRNFPFSSIHSINTEKSVCIIYVTFTVLCCAARTTDPCERPIHWE